MIPPNDHQPAPTAQNPAAAPRPARRRPAGAKAAAFGLMAVALVVLLFALGLAAFNLRWLKDWKGLREILFWRMRPLTMATFPNVATPERQDHLRACYKDPAKVDFNKISWDLFSRPTPFVGYAPEPGDQGEGHFNAQQLRNRQDVALPKPADVYRIFVTGGSHAYGIGAPSQDETIPAYLERILNERHAVPGKRVEVFNAAVCGWTSTHERILIENRIYAWQPDLVLALTGGNDAHWAFTGTDVQFMRGYEDELYFASTNTAMHWVGAKTYPAQPPAPEAAPVPPPVVAARFVRNMRLAALALEPTGARLVVALQPTLTTKDPLSAGERRWLEKEEPAGKAEYLDRCFAAIEADLNAGGEKGGEARKTGESKAVLDRNPANMREVQIRDVFQGRSDAIYFDLFHLADKGNELIAQRIADELQKLKL